MSGLARTTMWRSTLVAVIVLTLVIGGCSQPHDGVAPQPHPRADSERQASRPASPTPTPGDGAHPLEPTPVEPDLPPEPGGDGDELHSWYYTPNREHAVVAIPAQAADLLHAYGGRYTGPDAGRVYLTFDEGYETGNTSAILDTLAEAGVKATFFVTESYIEANPDLVRRMADEGHAVGNHTATHPSLPSLAGDPDAFAEELLRTERAYAAVTGRSMTAVVRPPMGQYSARSLWLTQKLGYETVFWSFAHRDWVTDEQPSVGLTTARILEGSHPGAIYLLHGVSSSDTQALGAVIEGLRAQGYGFGVLGEE